MRRYAAILALLLSCPAAPIVSVAQQEESEETLRAIAEVFTTQDIPPLLQKAQAGDGRAQILLALAYNGGFGTKQDYTEAATWARKAADQGIATAEDLLGKLYFLGQGTAQNSAEAIKWFRKAAERGSAEGEYDLGVMFFQGNGVSQNYAEALKWFRKAAEQGNPSAQFNLGGMYYQGLGVREDINQATKWITDAAFQGQLNAMEFWGSLPANDPQSYVNSYKWWSAAARFGSTKSANALDQMVPKMTSEQIAEAKGQATHLVNMIHAGPKFYDAIRASLDKEEPSSEAVSKAWDWRASAGGSLSLQEATREKRDGKTVVLFHLRASGFPQGKFYTLWVSRILTGQPELAVSGFFTDTRRKMVCWLRADASGTPNKSPKWCSSDLSELFFGLESYRPGEPIQVALIAKDLSTKVFSKAIPISIEARDKQCHLWVELASPEGELFGLWGEDFEPNEKVSYTSRSDGEELNGKADVSSDGKFMVLLAPAVVGKKSGLVSFEAKGKSCALRVTFPWGPPALETQ